MLALSIPLIPVVLFGLGEAHWMIDDVRGRALLDGVRGQPAAGVDALGLGQLSACAVAHADAIESIDITLFWSRPRMKAPLPSTP